MRVNEGQVQFYDVVTEKGNDEKTPTHAVPMEDLFREALYNDTVFDEESGKNIKKNRSIAWVERKINDIFLKSNQYRIDSSAFTQLNGIDPDKFEDYLEEYKIQDNFLKEMSVLNDKSKYVLATISLMPIWEDRKWSNWKKALLVNLGTTGALVDCGDEFRLLTEFTKEQKAGYTKEQIQMLIEDNQRYNNVIIELQKECQEKRITLLDNFIEKVKPLVLKDFQYDWEQKFRSNIDIFGSSSKGKSNMNRDIKNWNTKDDVFDKITGSGDKEDAELLIPKKYHKKFDELFNEFRNGKPGSSKNSGYLRQSKLLEHDLRIKFATSTNTNSCKQYFREACEWIRGEM